MASPISQLNSIDETTITDDAVLLVTNGDGGSYKITLADLKKALLTDDSITEDILDEEAVANTKLKSGAGEPGGAWNTWVPSWTNLTIGNAVVDAKYKQVGKTVFVRFKITLGSSSSASANTLVVSTLPVPQSSAYSGNSTPIGMGRIADAGSGNYPCYFRAGSGGFDIISFSSNGTWATEYGLPSTLGSGDVIEGSLKYEAA